MQQLDPKAKWIFFFQSLLAFFFPVLILSFCFGVPVASIITGDSVIAILIWAIIGLIIYIAVAYFWAGLTYKFWRYELTEDSLRIEKGVIWKKYVSIPYERIQNVDIHRGILARILGLSDLMIQTAGYSGGRHGRGSEGKLPGVSQMRAEQLRDELIRRAKGAKSGV